MLRVLSLSAVLALGLAAPAAGQHSLGTGYIERTGVGEGEQQRPPWTKIQVHGGFYQLPAKKMLTGEAMIVPFDPALPAINLTIQKLHPYVREECTGEMSRTRNVDLPDVTNDAYRNYVAQGPNARQFAPGNVLIVHPPAPNAKSLPKQSVAAGDLPKGYLPGSLDAAFDITGSGKAEVVQLTYCCKNPRFDEKQCQGANTDRVAVTCTALFRKTKAGWQRVTMYYNLDC